MKALILSNEYGFPNHANMLQIRSQIQPTQITTNKRNSSGYIGSDSCTSTSSSTASTSSNQRSNNNEQISINSSPEPQQNNIHLQQQKLIEVLF